ncbi:MAG: Lrp/AsnC family transcriptional regulator [Halioglobus sp.]
MATIANGESIGLCATDYELLSQLERGLVASAPDFSDGMGLTERQLACRIKHLEKNGIAQTLPLTSIEASGQKIAHFFICVSNRTAEDVANEIANLHSMIVVASLRDKYHLMASALISEDHSSYQALRELSVIPGIANVKIELVLHQVVNHIGHIRFAGAKARSPTIHPKPEMAVGFANGSMDALDVGLVTQLQEGSRVSNRKIAQKFDVTEGAVRYRIKKLQERNLLKFVPAFDPAVLGLCYWSWLQFDIQPEYHDEVLATIRSCSWIKYLAVTTGVKSLACLALTRSEKHLAAIVENEIRKLPGVRSVFESQLTANHKLDKRWGSFS